MSSLRRGHANLLCIVPILVYVLREQYVAVGVGVGYIGGPCGGCFERVDMRC